MRVLLCFGKVWVLKNGGIILIMVGFGRLICEKNMGLDKVVEGLPNLHIDQIFEILVWNEERVFEGGLGLRDGFEIVIELKGTVSDDLYIYLTSVIKWVVHDKNYI